MSNLWHKKMYDEWFAMNSLNSKPLLENAQSEIKFILEKTNLPKNSLVLDIPCGTGRHSLVLAQKP
jgi:cyclopropane fatty-acyl-phospholipid synthase-like methyltransferase